MEQERVAFPQPSPILHHSLINFYGRSSAYLLARTWRHRDGTAWSTQEKLDRYLLRLEEARKRDHRTLGKSLDLFSTLEAVGPGLILWHPHGGMVRFLAERFSQEAHLLNGYDWVYTPHIGRAGLWETSGHLEPG